MEQLRLFPEEDIAEIKEDPYPIRCPCCYRMFTRRGGMKFAVKYRDWISDNLDTVFETLTHRLMEYPPPDIALYPDLEYALRIEAEALGLDIKDIVNGLIERYLEGELKRLIRRRRRYELNP